jgi:tRNA pseudouridine38-40 synthase
MARYKITLEYAGTRTAMADPAERAHWQGELARVVRDVTGRRIRDLGSGRTDAGVHALAQVVHLDIINVLPAETLQRRLNDGLPSDINILSLELARGRFHARHDALARSYLYQISRRRSAFAKHFVWWVRDDLDLERMRQTAAHFSGMKEFRSFTMTARRTNRRSSPSTASRSQKTET